ncbi:MAG: RIP metalloprotease RseP [Rikenellaceae bacterium]
MEILIKIIQFFLCFTLLVGAHEFGHFIVARIFKIRVEKFYIFFDPWFSLFKFKKGDTEYGLGWLPLGGYCKIAGMIDESMDLEQMKLPAKDDEFRSKPAWQRFLVMVAGVTMNILLAIVIYCGVSYSWGDRYFSNEDAKWGYNFSQVGHSLGFEDGDRFVTIDGAELDNIDDIARKLVLSEGDRTVIVSRRGVEHSVVIPLESLIDMRQNKDYQTLFELRMPFLIDSVVSMGAAALKKGDEVVGLNGRELDGYYAYREALSASKGEIVKLSVLRGADTLKVDVPISNEGLIGVMAANPYQMRIKEYTIFEAIPAGFIKAGDMVKSYWGQLSLIAKPETEMYKELGGFVAIGSMFSGSWDWYDFWLKSAFLSVILAVMNVLPIPGLDGGHMLFTLWEMITGRKPSDKFLEYAQYVGLLLLFTLLLYANGNDFYRLIFK